MGEGLGWGLGLHNIIEGYVIDKFYKSHILAFLFPLFHLQW